MEKQEQTKKIYYIQIDENDDTGMDAISLVENPAVELDFLCFSKQEPIRMNFNDTQHIITGVVALADTPIYRYSETVGEYYIVFTKETILKMLKKYSKQKLFNSVNLEHNDDQFVDGVYMIESYIVNAERNIKPKEFENVPEGSWICSFYVEDDNLWKEITSNTDFKGFSLQGLFNFSPTAESKDKFEKETNVESEPEDVKEDFDSYIDNLVKEIL